MSRLAPLCVKMERVWQRDDANQREASKDMTDYIVGLYNCVRLHSTGGNFPPMIYERDSAAKEPTVVSEIT